MGARVLWWAIGIAVTPMVLAFVAGFFGVLVPLGWTFYILWALAWIGVGVMVTVARR